MAESGEEPSADELPPGATRAQREAARWLARLTSGEATESDRSAFAQWRAERAEHARAAEELAALWLHLDRIQPHSRLRLRRSGARYLALAASMIAVLCGFRAWHQWRFDYVTAVGEHRNLVLREGSRIELNSDTALDVRIDEHERHVSLVRGEAYFDVVHDSRPFIVDSGDVQVRDIGTAFSVRRDTGSEVHITVERGEVEVDDGGSHAHLKAGQGAVSDAGHDLQVGPADPSVDLAWRRGRLIVVDQTLASVAQLLSRYRHGYILITDPAKADLRVNAVVNLNDIDAWLLALPQVEPVELIKVGPLIWIR